MATKKISIVVPVKNGMATLPDFIEGIQAQTLFSETEVVVIDSSSTDGSVAFLSKFDFVKVISIDPKTFNHGATRNLGVEQAKGDFIVMTVQDAVPVKQTWLADFLKHFEDDAVMGVSGQQVVPHDNNKNPHQWFMPQSMGVARSVYYPNAKDFIALTPKAQRRECGWDDVNAIYRKKALTVLPFEPLMFGEDMLWAKMALEKGFKLIYDHTIGVYHYHHQFADYTYNRTLITKLFIYKCFNFMDSRTYALKDYVLVVYRNFKWGYPFKWIAHNFEIIYNHRKATKFLVSSLNNGTLETLEKHFALNIPIGQQNVKK